MAKFLYLLALATLIGCSGLSQKELDLKVAKYVLPKKEAGKNSVYLISPNGYYEPWTHFNFIVGTQKLELFFGEYKQVNIPVSRSIQVSYQYDEVYKRVDKTLEEKWINISFSDFDDNGELFLILKDELLIQIDKKTALQEIVTIEHFNQK
jgi:hypothetical protein